MHWVVIQSGGTQRFIFDSNKRRLNVGASYLITRLPDWVDDALRTGLPGKQCRAVVNISSVANVLVPDVDTGRSLLSQVTRRALAEAPGLPVWGYVDPQPAGPDYASTLQRCYEKQEERRAVLPSALARFPGSPFTARCTFSGLPATTQITDKQGDPPKDISAVAEAKRNNSRDGLRKIHGRLARDRSKVDANRLEAAVLSHRNLDKDLGQAWTSVVHVDGNGVGQLLIQLADQCQPEEYVDQLANLSRELDDLAASTLAEAVLEVHEDGDQDWILPLIAGGDDLTAIVDARKARRFTVAYLKAFEKQTGSNDAIKSAADRVSAGRTHLTACAGIAVVKPSHPFHQAYALSEELCRSAKEVKVSAPDCSALDIQVFHESVGRVLEDVRGDLSAPGARQKDQLWPGPLLVTGAAGGLATEAALREVIDGLRSMSSDSDTDDRVGLSASERHVLRTALTDLPSSPSSWERASQALLARVRGHDPDRVPAVEAVLAPGRRAYLLTAMDLLDAETAPADRRRAAKKAAARSAEQGKQA